jgi:SAM-dependent methyltransferase
MPSQVTPNHYCGNYDTKERFCSYWHQIQEIRECNPKIVLEIGIGNGFVSEYLLKRGFDIVRSDLDSKLLPDVTCTILDTPFLDDSFDVVACFELLEHLPFENFEKALLEIRRISRNWVVLSVPDSTQAYRFDLQLPKIGDIRKLVLLPNIRFRKPIEKFDGEHYWQIGKDGYPLKRINACFTKAKLFVMKTYRVFEMPYHRFFILKKLT